MILLILGGENKDKFLSKSSFNIKISLGSFFMKQFLKWLILSGIFAILTACGGGSNNLDNNVNTKKEVHLDTKDININLDDNYSIVTEDTTIPFSTSTPINIEVNKKDITPVILSNKYGEPILYTLTKKDDSKVDITIESTAVVFTIKTSRFFGLKITDYNTLSERIKNHPKFSKLISELKFYINTSSPCPTNHTCNLVASDIAMQIANEIKILDITKKAE
jgi:hypothetical protein